MERKFIGSFMYVLSAYEMYLVLGFLAMGLCGFVFGEYKVPMAIALWAVAVVSFLRVMTMSTKMLVIGEENITVARFFKNETISINDISFIEILDKGIIITKASGRSSIILTKVFSASSEREVKSLIEKIKSNIGA
ncbi:MAG: hypothetical protein RSB66_06785 [Clostridium sp.]